MLGGVSSGLLVLYQRLESIDRLVPLVGDLVQVAARLGQALRLELVNLRPTLASAAYKPGVFQSVQMLGDRLARDARPLAETNDGLGPAGAQSGDDAQPSAIAERRKHWRCLGEVPCGGIAQSGHRAMEPPYLFAAPARYFSMSFAWAVHPCSFAVKAFARRSRGIRSKPDSVITSLVPPATSSNSKVMRVVGSFE